MIEHALELADAGWLVFPLQGKAPAVAGGQGFHDATDDVERIRAWWRRWPHANIGIAVPVGMVVIDIDPRDGGDETLSDLEHAHRPLPPTLTVRTGSGGSHLWFKAVTDGMQQADLGPGLQTRIGGRGYVVAPPSIHPETHQPYQWVQPLSSVARLPEWVVARLRPPEPSRGSESTLTVIEGGGRGFLAWAYDRVRQAPQGQGHDILLRTAITAGGYVAAGLVSESEARRVLVDAADCWERPYRNAERTIDDGLRYGREVKGPVAS